MGYPYPNFAYVLLGVPMSGVQVSLRVPTLSAGFRVLGSRVRELGSGV